MMEKMRTLGSILISLALLTAGCAPATDAGDERPAETSIRTGTFTDRILLTGEIEAAVAETVSVPRLPSWQSSLRWLAEEGSLLKKGDRVAELDTASFANDLDSRIEAEAEAREALRQHQEETRADLAEKEFEFLRCRTEFEKARMNAEVPEEIVSRKEYEERQLTLERARTELQKAETLLESRRRARAAEQQNLELDLTEKRRQIAVAERAIETMTLHAPTDGVLVLNEHPWFRRPLEVGDNVWVGFQIARIPDLSTLQVKADLFDVDDGVVAPGMKATVVIDAFPGKTFQGTVSRISAVAEEDAGSSLLRTFEVIVDLGGLDADALRPGLSARVEIETAKIESATIVDRAAVSFAGHTPQLVLADGSRSDVEVLGCNPLECAVQLKDPEMMGRVASR